MVDCFVVVEMEVDGASVEVTDDIALSSLSVDEPVLISRYASPTRE